MTKKSAPWIRNRGLSRILAQETNVSDLLQFLSDRDPAPWEGVVGFVPDLVDREVGKSNHADLLLKSGPQSVVIEVKLGHQMSTDQQEKYEALASRPNLFLAGLEGDRGRLGSTSNRWDFLALSALIRRWERVDDELARLLASEAAGVFSTWDEVIAGVFETPSSPTWRPLAALNQKFLARVTTRMIARELQAHERLAWAGVTSGGGLPLVQAWTPIRNEGRDRAFMVEVRWWETKPGGELRFGVDFDPRPGQEEDEEVRRSAYSLARSMDAAIGYEPLKAWLADERSGLAELLRRETPTRPAPRGDWEAVIARGFAGAPLANGKRNTRRQTSPDFFGDGALRFQAIAEIDFARASGHDVIQIIDATLTYLTAHQP